MNDRRRQKLRAYYLSKGLTLNRALGKRLRGISVDVDRDMKLIYARLEDICTKARFTFCEAMEKFSEGMKNLAVETNKVVYTINTGKDVKLDDTQDSPS